MDKFEEFITDYDCSKYDSLPTFMKIRCNALMAIQLEIVRLQKQYEPEVPALEDKYAELYTTLYLEKVQYFPRKMKHRVKALKELHLEHLEMLEDYHKCLRDTLVRQETSYQSFYVQRHQLITGELDASEKVDVTGSWARANPNPDGHFTRVEERIIEDLVDGMPAFWLGALASCHRNDFSKGINRRDRLILRYLNDVRLIYGHVFDTPTYKLEFCFDDNDYFTNRVLTKTYFLSFDFDGRKDLFSYGGFKPYKSVGTEISWIASKGTSGAADSFFNLFRTLEPSAGSATADFEQLLDYHFLIGETIRLYIVPKAPLFYAGFMDGDNSEESESE